MDYSSDVLSILDRSLTLLERFIPFNDKWKKQERELLSAYVEAVNRVIKITEENKDALKTNVYTTNRLIYELKKDKRTERISDFYAMISSLMVQLESTIDSKFKMCLTGEEKRIQKGLEIVIDYIKSWWSVLLPQRRRLLYERIQTVSLIFTDGKVDKINLNLDGDYNFVTQLIIDHNQEKPIKEVDPISNDVYMEAQSIVNRDQVDEALLMILMHVGKEDIEKTIEGCPIDVMRILEIEQEIFPVSEETQTNKGEQTKEIKYDTRQRKPSVSYNKRSSIDEKKEQESLTTSIGETANKLRNIAYQSHEIIIKDKKMLSETTNVQDNFLHETKTAYVLSKHLAWIGSLSFFQELFMIAVAVGLFLLTLSVITSTLLIA